MAVGTTTLAGFSAVATLLLEEEVADSVLTGSRTGTDAGGLSLLDPGTQMFMQKLRNSSSSSVDGLEVNRKR
jgi:hypothetical protein